VCTWAFFGHCFLGFSLVYFAVLKLGYYLCPVMFWD